jgi:hypothetical protein
MRRLASHLAVVRDFLGRFGDMMGSAVLAVLYVVLLGPIAVVLRLLSNPLRLRPKGSGFVPWERGNETLTAARRQG